MRKRDGKGFDGSMMLPIVFVVFILGSLYLSYLYRIRRDAQRRSVIGERVLGGDTEGAKALAVAWDRGATTPAAQLRLAQSYSSAGDHQRALAIVNSTEISSGRLTRPLRRIAAQLKFESLEALGQSEEAAWFLNDVMREDPKAPWLVVKRVVTPAPSAGKPSLHAQVAELQTAFADHRYDEAAEMMQALMHRASRNPVARAALPSGYLALGTAQLAAGQDAAAEASFGAFMQASRDPEAAAKALARARAGSLLVGGRFEEARSAYEELVATQGAADAYVGLAQCDLRLGEPERAGADLDRAVELGYDADKARLIRSQIVADLGRHDEAIDLAREAAGSYPPSDRQTTYTLAYVLATAQHPDAEAALRRYVEVLPHDPDLPHLLNRSAPDGRTWREYLALTAGPEG